MNCFNELFPFLTIIIPTVLYTTNGIEYSFQILTIISNKASKLLQLYSFND